MIKQNIARGIIAGLMLTSCMAGVAEAKPLKSITSGVSTTPSWFTPRYRNINPFYRNIGAFWGDVNPFYRNIGAFWGDVDPFYRNIGAFWGDLNPLYRNIGAFGGAIVPDYRNIGAFWEQTGALWTTIDAQWDDAGMYLLNRGAYQSLTSQLGDLRTRSEAYWGAAVQSQTGKSFNAGFANAVFAKHGIDLANPSSLANLSAAERSHFFMDWYDGLMNFSGTDHVDHWMKTANWNPTLTQTQGSGAGTTIGLVDIFIAGDADIKAKTTNLGGASTYSNGHGAGVASLMVSSHDGKGVMGIAPAAKIAAYNPFDATGTADWPDVRKGIIAVNNAGASIVNLSLGVPGWTLHPDWRGVFRDSEVMKFKDKSIYVIAAGNDGVTQTTGVNMKDAFDNTFIVVGSVDPTGVISEFSNRPGTTCLLEDRDCKDNPQDKLTDQLKASGLLMRRFIVAPGELILVSDDKGGTTRLSGTSFAAPLVSGAIALLHDRWPWLKDNPRETAAIILKTAKDLGAPGIDPVYGVGLLDVEASQSPISFSNLKYYLVENGKQTEIKVSALRSGGVQSAWVTKNLYFSAFEDFEGIKRDFLIPLSSRLVGTKQGGEFFQQYVYNRMTSWLGGTNGFTDTPRYAFGGPADGWSVAMTARLANAYPGRRGVGQPKLASSMSFASPSGKVGFSIGNGDGAAGVGAQAGFGLRSDYDARSGGVNPVLGFANGGAHAAVQLAVAPRLTVSFGMSESANDPRDQREIEDAARFDPALLNLKAYRAAATNVRADYRIGSAVSLSASMTRLEERRSLLGVRSIEPTDLDAGTATDAVTIGADVALGRGLSLSGSASGSRTASRGNDAGLRIGSAGLMGSSFALGLAKQRVFGKHDRMRLSLSQPLTIERGAIDFKSVAVVDRATGEIGVVTQKIDVAATQRRFVAEAIYATPVLGGAAELSAFGRRELTGYEDAAIDLPSYIIGVRGSLAF